MTTGKNTLLNRLTPSVSKGWLFLLAGLMWSGVGVLLCSFAYGWLAGIHTLPALLAGLGGLTAALAIYRFGFLGIARRNIQRLRLVIKDLCLFAFMPAKSYLLVAVMMTMGIVLRHSAIPRLYLAPLYAAIGAALFLSSLHYYPHAWSHARGQSAS